MAKNLHKIQWVSQWQENGLYCPWTSHNNDKSFIGSNGCHWTSDSTRYHFLKVHRYQWLKKIKHCHYNNANYKVSIFQIQELDYSMIFNLVSCDILADFKDDLDCCLFVCLFVCKYAVNQKSPLSKKSPWWMEHTGDNKLTTSFLFAGFYCAVCFG